MIKAKQEIQELVRLDNSEMDRAGYLRLDKNEDIIGFNKKTIKDMLRTVDADIISAYPEVHRLYNKISKWLGLPKDRIYISAGSDGAIKAVFEAYVCPGDEVMVLHPTYAMYYVYSDMFGAKLKKVCFDGDLMIPYERIVSTISGKTKLICIANPNSPTGTVLGHSDLVKIIGLAAKKGIIVLMDEAYYGYYPATCMDLVGSFDNLIVTRSFTKIYGLGCARLGFAVSNKNIISNLKKVRPIYEVNTFSVILGCYVIDHPEILKEHTGQFNAGKKFLLNQLTRMGLDYFESYANFVLIKMGSSKEAIRVADGLRKRKILVKAGFSVEPLSDCIRVSISKKGHMEKFVVALEKVISLTRTGKKGG